MELDRIAIKLRPRNSWEGIDLGFAMAQRWFRPLWLLWLGSALPVMLVLTLLPLPLWLSGLLLWWLKPVYEPPLLHWLSRRVFSEELSLKTVFRSWRRIVLPQLFAALTWRRFMGSRSFFMPVVVLEGVRGKRRAERIRVLGRSTQAGFWLTLVGIHIETILQIGLLVLIFSLIPEDLLWTDWNTYLFEPDPATEWLQHLVATLVMSVFAPFYVAGGFALYLTRRSQLEAWDLELGLRRMAGRQRSSGLATLAGIVVAAWLSMGTVPGNVQAGTDPASARDDTPQTQQASSRSDANRSGGSECKPRVEYVPVVESAGRMPGYGLQTDAQAVRETVDAVLAEPVFGRRETVYYWEPKQTDEEEDEEEVVEPIDSAWIRIAAQVVELLMWLGLGGLVAYLVHWLVNNRGWLRGGVHRGRPVRPLPTQLAGLDLRQESLPDDPAEAARRLLEQGDHRAALGLLYRATLSRLVHRHQLEIHEGDTEGSCLARARRLSKPGLLDYFTDLTGHWQRLAYAHQPPDPAIAAALCDTWQRQFGVSHDA
ncbi:MAG: DUF4129 domain-containing protein [Candidatus Thiodiazotropha sp.]